MRDESLIRRASDRRFGERYGRSGYRRHPRSRFDHAQFSSERWPHPRRSDCNSAAAAVHCRLDHRSREGDRNVISDMTVATLLERLDPPPPIALDAPAMTKSVTIDGMKVLHDTAN